MQTVNDIANAFYSTCKGKLTIPETAVYWSLVAIWNSQHRPDGISVSRQEAMAYAGIKDKHAFDKARKGLEEKGLIKSISQSRTSPRKFYICEVETRGVNTLVDKQTRGGNALVGTSKKTARGLTPLALGGQTPQARGLNAPITETEIYRDRESLSKAGNTFEIHTPPEREIPTCPDDVWQKYLTYRPQASLHEKKTLAIWSEEYGTRAVKDAIDKGIQSGGKSMNYIGQILRNGGTNGRRHKAYGRHHTHEISEDPDKWKRAEETLITNYDDFFGPEDDVYPR